MVTARPGFLNGRSRFALGPRGWSDLDWPLVFLSLALALFGVVTIYSITLDDPRIRTAAARQAVWLVLGLIAGGVLLLEDYRRYLRYAFIFFGIVAGLLILTHVLGARSKGASRWLSIPGVPIRVQPSELAKLAVVMVLARMLAGRKEPLRNLTDTLPVLAVVAPVALLVLKQPDLGTSLVFVPIVGGMLYVAGLPAAYYLFIIPMILGLARPVIAEAGIRTIFSGWFLPWVWIGSLVAVAAFAWRRRIRRADLLLLVLITGMSYFGSPRVWDSLKGYQKARVLSFINPDADPRGTSYHLRQAKIALGSGGFTGKGWAQGTQSGLRFLPEYQTDFVFSAMGEQWGFVGTTALLSLFFLFLWRGIQIAQDARSPEGTYLATGIVLMFTTHVAVNVGICLGVMPVTGLPLSFISYGGSSLLVNFLAVSLLVNVGLRKFE
jgi:rod shape determining protein RodA